MKNDITLLAEAYQTVLEKEIKRTGSKIVGRQDISNFLFKITDGGREVFSIWTTRKNDSKSDPSKKAGMPMILTGRLGSCKATLAASTERRPELSTPEQYKKNMVLRMCVTSIDGENYTNLPAEKRTRSFDVTNVTRIEAGGEVYDIV
jgi:hypothetical protein